MNLEARHRREGSHLLSSDHVLDVWIDARGVVQMKDEDELEMAVEHGLFSTAEKQQIEDDARAAVQAFRADRFPFNEPWWNWRPNPAWRRPVLPRDVRWEFDELDA